MLEQNMNDSDNDTTGGHPPSTSPQKSTTGRILAIPEDFQSIQANFCKTPGRENFGVPPALGPIQMGRRKSADAYASVSGIIMFGSVQNPTRQALNASVSL